MKWSISEEEMRSLLRGEVTVRDFFRGKDFSDIGEIEFYHPGWEDVEALLSNLEEKDPLMEDLFRDWGIMFREPDEDEEDEDDEEILLQEEEEEPEWLPIDLPNYFIWKDMEEYEKYPQRMDWLGVLSPGEGRRRIVEAIAENSYDMMDSDIRAVSSGSVDIRRIREDIERMKAEDWERNITEWRWTDSAKFEALEHAEGYGFGGPSIKPEETEEARTILNELCDRGIPEALDLRAYSAYGGSYLWPCDWEVSRDSLLALMDNPDADEERRGQYANTLGYIYYYGRCSGGVPDYDTALKYYVIGAACGIHESIYKIADMMKGGKGMPKSPQGALNLIDDVHSKCRKAFLSGFAFSDLPDTSLRAASLLAEYGKHFEALGSLLEGDCAMTIKRHNGTFYGDDQVAFSIRKRIEEEKAIVPQIPFGEIPLDVISYMGEFLSDGTPAVGKLSADPDGNRVLTISKREGETKYLFLTVPCACYCNVIDEARYTLLGIKDLHIRGNRKEFLYDRFEQDHEGLEWHTLTFYRDDKETARFTVHDVAMWMPPNYRDEEEDGDSHRMASCSFEEGGKTYDYLADDMDVEAGDMAVVDTWNGETEVFVEKVHTIREADLPMEIDKYKMLVRIIKKEE